MQQFFVEQIVKDQVFFNEQQQHKLRNVLRYADNDEVMVIDSSSRVFLTQLQISPNNITGKIISELNSKQNNPIIHLYPALIKKDKWEWLIQKAVEFGATDITPLITTNCVVKLDDKLTIKVKRWNDIALAAAQQCKKTEIVRIFNPVKINDLIKQVHGLKLIAYEKSSIDDHIVTLLKEKAIDEISIVIGPEGGFTSQEIVEFEQAEFNLVSLGARVYRAESASIYALSVIDALNKLKL